MKISDGLIERWRGFTAVAAVLGLLLVCFLEAPAGLDPRGFRTLGVTGLMAVLWLTEVLPIPVTSLLPLLLFPLLGILPSGETASQYASDLGFLFFGGFFMASVIERWGLHRRLALRVIMLFGVRPGGLILGVMTAVAFLSMWISNTAATLMMLPICLALVVEVEADDEVAAARFAKALLLAVAYAANVGGMGTPIGTAPNAIFLREFGDTVRLSFLQWMVIALPLVAVFLVVVHQLLTRVLFRFGPGTRLGRRDLIATKLAELGPMSRQEIHTACIFGLVVLLWVLRSDFVIGGWRLPGWVSGLEALGLDRLAGGARSGIGDSAVAILGVLLMCLDRVGPERRPLADWTMARDLPWGLLLLLGGGFAIARAFQVGDGPEGSSLSSYVAEQLSGGRDLGAIVLVPITATVMTFLTEVTSNTATTAVVMPILAGMGAAELGRAVGLAATFSASCAFMLPVATPPNAIVFGANRLRIADMVRAGLLINLVGIVLVTLTVLLIAANVMPGI